MVNVNDIFTAAKVILAFFGALAIVSGGMNNIAKFSSPFKKLRTDIDANKAMIDVQSEEIHDVEISLVKIEDANKMICRSLFVLLNHEITGNSVDKLKEQRDSMEQFLIDK